MSRGEQIKVYLWRLVFHNTISELENIRLAFLSLTTKAEDNSKQFQWRNVVFCNKTKPLFVGYANAKIFQSFDVILKCRDSAPLI